MRGVASEGGETLLTLSFVPGIGPRTLLKLAGHPKFLETNVGEMGLLLPTLEPKLTEAAVAQAADLARDNLDHARRDGARLLTFVDQAFPALLRQTPDPPALLFVKGELRQERRVAVIGTREPTPHGVEIARRSTTYLAERGWSVVSGLALGVDALAHQAALDVGGHTVAVLAHGLQTIAPRQHTALAGRILEQGGALVSEYPYGVGVFPAHFVKRDRTQAGLAQGVLMIQTDVQGGSLHASRACIDYGRPLAVPRPTRRDIEAGEPKVQGNLHLLGEPREAARLLKCREGDLHHLVPLTSREDYPRFESAMLANRSKVPAGLW
ncbi:DNA-processing protein DprA [Deinococcus sp.]|uniref:DNA-processing protein DprA n=1 Tax=Deinococcus sp. TaxID=47478 RepID=UPI0025C5DB91|nr:DNA-processing protein DprA [Deinococcus sp.]